MYRSSVNCVVVIHFNSPDKLIVGWARLLFLRVPSQELIRVLALQIICSPEVSSMAEADYKNIRLATFALIFHGTLLLAGR